MIVLSTDCHELQEEETEMCCILLNSSPQVDEGSPPNLQVFMSHLSAGQGCGEATQLQSYQ